jgi:formylglycine-generating enzyme required for sulfatase activity
MKSFLSLPILAALLLAGSSKQGSPPPKPATGPMAVAGQIAMAEIPGGAFIMGTSPQMGFQNGFPAHQVTVRPFRMGRYEVTFDQYDPFAAATGRPLPPDEGLGRGDRPVIHVSWADAQAFTAWLNAGTGRHFRLPSEAEWEYAARAGTTTLYWWGDKADQNMMNVSGVAGRDKWEATAPVGSFPANPFGLYDVLGNVWELVEDCRRPNYDATPTDGSAVEDHPCDMRVARGGSYANFTRGVQVAARAAAGEQFTSMGLGFRLAEDKTTPGN